MDTDRYRERKRVTSGVVAVMVSELLEEPGYVLLFPLFAVDQLP